jgi:ATP-binding cassette subfamily C (CFTR/MRP) protein 1
MLSIQRLQQLIEVAPEDNSTVKQSKGVQLRGKIEFKNVEMRYKADLDPALRDLSFTINEGEHVAVVGRTGAGKSSLFQLLFRFRNANKGTVLLDGKPIDSLDLKELRSQLNVVLQ